MEVTLVIVTLISLALAMAMGVIVWRLLQEDRLRADARVAALEQGLAESLHTHPPSAPVPRDEAFVRDDTDWLAQFPPSTSLAAAARETPLDLHGPARREAARVEDVEGTGVRAVDLRRLDDTVARVENRRRVDRAGMIDADTIDAVDSADLDAAEESAEGADASDGQRADASVPRAGMFGQVERTEDEGLSRRVVAIAAVAAIVISGILAFWAIGRLTSPGDAASGPGSGAGSGTGVQSAAAAASNALELVSLRHVQQDGTLTITGLVRNPHGGAPQERLTAVVFFFDGSGGFLSSTRAPLDFRTLGPGEESPFQLTAPAPSNVARYRVSFRREEGAIVPHVDRRQQQEASRS